MKYLLPVIILLFACVFVGAQEGIPEGAKTCLKGCCDQVGGEYDEKTSYCNIDYETSIKESFQNCQMSCVAQNLQKPTDTHTPTTAAGQSTEQTDQSSDQKLPCMSMLLPLITIALAGILRI